MRPTRRQPVLCVWKPHRQISVPDCFFASFVLTLFIFKAPNYVLARTLTEWVVACFVFFVFFDLWQGFLYRYRDLFHELTCRCIEATPFRALQEQLLHVNWRPLNMPPKQKEEHGNKGAVRVENGWKQRTWRSRSVRGLACAEVSGISSFDKILYDVRSV